MICCSCVFVTDQTYDSLYWGDPRLVLLTLSSPGCLRGGYQECSDQFAVYGNDFSYNAQPQVDPGYNIFMVSAWKPRFSLLNAPRNVTQKIFVISSRFSMVMPCHCYFHKLQASDKRLDHDAPLFVTFCKNWELWKERRNYISEWILVEQVRAEQISQSPSDSWSQSFNLAPSIKSSLKISPKIPFSRAEHGI